MLNVAMLNIVMFNVIMLNIVMLNAVMLNVDMLSVTAPFGYDITIIFLCYKLYLGPVLYNFFNHNLRTFVKS